MPRKPKQGKRKASTAKRRSNKPQREAMTASTRTVSSLPVSTYVSSSNSAWLKMTSAPAQKGIAGVRINGRQPFAVVKGDSTFTTNVFESPASAPNAAVLSGNAIAVNPVTFRGRLASIASTYERFVFRRIRFIYSTNQPLNVSGNSMTLGIHSDGTFDGDAPVNAAELRQGVPSLTFPIFAPTATIDYRYDGTGLYYVSAIQPSDQRFYNQCLFMGFWVNSTFTGSTALGGYIDIEYEVELYNPTFSQSLSLSSVPGVAEAATYLREYERKERRKAQAQILLGSAECKEERKDGDGTSSGVSEEDLVSVPPLGGTGLSASPSNENLLKRLAQLLGQGGASS
jgi:hypothetical protein